MTQPLAKPAMSFPVANTHTDTSTESQFSIDKLRHIFEENADTDVELAHTRVRYGGYPVSDKVNSDVSHGCFSKMLLNPTESEAVQSFLNAYSNYLGQVDVSNRKCLLCGGPTDSEEDNASQWQSLLKASGWVNLDVVSFWSKYDSWQAVKAHSLQQNHDWGSLYEKDLASMRKTVEAELAEQVVKVNELTRINRILTHLMDASETPVALSDLWLHRVKDPDYFGNLDWLIVSDGKLKELRNLEKGWDGYQGDPLSPDIERVARRLLVQLYHDGIPAPSLVPGSDGSLQMEWHFGQYDLEIDIMEPEWIEVDRYDLTTETEESFKLGDDISKLANWVKDLSRTISSKE